MNDIKVFEIVHIPSIGISEDVNMSMLKYKVRVEGLLFQIFKIPDYHSYKG